MLQLPDMVDIISVVVLVALVASVAFSATGQRAGPLGISTMKKFSKAQNAVQTDAAFNAAKALPFATLEQVQEAFSGCHTLDNPALPSLGRDYADGRPGLQSPASNYAVYRLAGFRVSVKHLESIMATLNFRHPTTGETIPGSYNPMHATDLCFLKRHETGHMVWAKGPGWVALNPEFFGTGTPLFYGVKNPAPVADADPTIENATGLQLAAIATAKPAKPATAKPAKATAKPATAKALEKSKKATATDLATGKALASK